MLGLGFNVSIGYVFVNVRRFTLIICIRFRLYADGDHKDSGISTRSELTKLPQNSKPILPENPVISQFASDTVPSKAARNIPYCGLVDTI